MPQDTLSSPQASSVADTASLPDTLSVVSSMEKASTIVIQKLDGWLEDAIAMFPNFVVAVIVIVLFYFLSKLVKLLLGKALHTFMDNQSIIQLTLTLTGALIMLLALLVALNILQLQQTVTSILAGVGLIGLALSFAFQDMAGNFIAGVAMAVKSPVNVGDIIESNDLEGTVTHIGLRATTIETPQGQDIVIPNRLIYQNPYKHYTIHHTRRIDLEVGVSYGDDLEKVERITKEAVASIDYLQKEKGVKLYYQEFGDSSINFVIMYWVTFNSYQDYLQAVSDGIKRIKKAYNDNDIMIPFPIRTLDFGIKGGEKLDAMLQPRVER